MIYTILDKLTLLSPFILLIGILIGFYRYHTLNPVYRILFGYLMVCMAFDIMTRIPGLVWTTNLVFLVLFSLVELLLFYLLYLKLYAHKRNAILLVFVPLGISYIIGELFWMNFRDQANFQSYAKVVDTACVVLMAIGCFFDRLNQSALNAWFFFRINSAILICFSFYIVFFVPINFLIKGDAAQLYLWMLHLAVTIGFYLFIAVELWKNGNTRKQLPFG